MSTRKEIEAKIEANMRDMIQRINSLDKTIEAMTRKINAGVMVEVLRDEMQTTDTGVDLFEWNYERSWKPGRKCFTTLDLILPGTYAYKGRLTAENIASTGYPTEIWLTKEEYIMLRLKGNL